MEIQPSFGYIPSKQDDRDERFSYSLPVTFLEKVPESASVKYLFPPVYDQLNLGSCVAQAKKGLMEAAYIKQGIPNPVLSALMLYYHGLEAQGVFQDIGCTPRDVLKAATKIGVCREELWPYDVTKFANRPSPECYADAARYKIISYHAMAPMLELLKGCIAEGYPFSAGLRVFENFPLELGVNDVPMPAGKEIGGHDIDIVAYDDNTRRFLLRNSWSRIWAMDGYATIPYDYLLYFATDLWTIRLVNAFDPNAVLPVENKTGCLTALMNKIIQMVSGQ